MWQRLAPGFVAAFSTRYLLWAPDPTTHLWIFTIVCRLHFTKSCLVPGGCEEAGDCGESPAGKPQGPPQVARGAAGQLLSSCGVRLCCWYLW